MRTNDILGITGGVLSVAAVAFAINTGGGVGGNGPPHSVAWCFMIYDMVMIMVLLWVVQCTVKCGPEGQCSSICVRKALIVWDIATILLLVCIGTHPF